MIVIAECGSTKCDWCLIGSTDTIEFTSPGINPSLSSDQEIHQLLISSVVPRLGECYSAEIFFYGAGIREETALRMKSILSLILNPKEIEIHTDIYAAARALCGFEPGVACILGTGSNSCVYDGKTITHQFFSPGYFFGDEGGGVYIGKLLLNEYLRNRLDKDISEELTDEFKLTRDSILDSTYRKPYPNRYLAGFVPFVAKRIANPLMRKIVIKSFETFIQDQLLSLDFKPDLPVHFTGSVASQFQDMLKMCMENHGFTTGKILKSPMKGLIDYHTGN